MTSGKTSTRQVEGSAWELPWEDQGRFRTKTQRSKVQVSARNRRSRNETNQIVRIVDWRDQVTLILIDPARIINVSLTQNCIRLTTIMLSQIWICDHSNNNWLFLVYLRPPLPPQCAPQYECGVHIHRTKPMSLFVPSFSFHFRDSALFNPHIPKMSNFRFLDGNC